jgi:hypothetical protein
VVNTGIVSTQQQLIFTINVVAEALCAFSKWENQSFGPTFWSLFTYSVTQSCQYCYLSQLTINHPDTVTEGIYNQYFLKAS